MEESRLLAHTSFTASPWVDGCLSRSSKLVIVGGAELFTGNALIVMAWASRRISTAALLRNKNGL